MVRPHLARVDRLQRLAVFEAAARLGGFTAAAAELGSTQPAVTRQIRSLEHAIGVDLFTRTANRSALTDAGQRLWTHVAAGLDTFEAGLLELSDTSQTFVLAAHPGVAQQWLVPRLDGLQRSLGELDLRLWLFDRDDEIGTSGFDAAIRVGAGQFVGQSSRRLFQESVVPVASPAFAAAHGLDAASTADDVYRAPFIHMDDGDRPWMTWADWLDHFGLRIGRRAHRVLFHNYPMVLQQALAGRGVALGWRHLIDDLIAGDALTVVGPEVTSHRGYYLTWPLGEPSRAVAALLEWLDEQLEGQETV